MKKWGLLFTFFSFFIIQLHAIVPHHHHNSESFTIEDNSSETELIELLSHVFEIDLGENHLSIYQNDTDVSFSPLLSVISLEVNHKAIVQNQNYLPFYLQRFYQSPHLKNTKNKAPPILG